jgi:hypothetical protein
LPRRISNLRRPPAFPIACCHGYDSLGYINTMTPPFLLAIVFGLSMDYSATVVL